MLAVAPPAPPVTAVPLVDVVLPPPVVTALVLLVVSFDAAALATVELSEPVAPLLSAVVAVLPTVVTLLVVEALVVIVLEIVALVPCVDVPEAELETSPEALAWSTLAGGSSTLVAQPSKRHPAPSAMAELGASHRERREFRKVITRSPCSVAVSVAVAVRLPCPCTCHTCLCRVLRLAAQPRLVRSSHAQRQRPGSGGFRCACSGAEVRSNTALWPRGSLPIALLFALFALAIRGRASGFRGRRRLLGHGSWH